MLVRRPGRSAASIAEAVSGRVLGDGDVVIERLAPIDAAGPGDLAHLSSPAWRPFLDCCDASALLVGETDAQRVRGTAIVVADPYLAYARVSRLFDDAPALAAGISPEASLGEGAVLDDGVALGPGVRIGAGVRLGAGTLVGPNAVVEAGAVLGRDCRIHAGAVIGHGVMLGDRCVVRANAVVGGDGFGYARAPDGRREAIAQLGTVRLGDEVEIGAGSTVDRGALGDTVLEDGVKIDNQVQIGHNVRIGRDSVICGCCGIVGGTTIGQRCVLAGGVGIGGDGPVTIADDVVVSGMSFVSRSIERAGVYSSGTLHQPSRRWKRNALRATRLDELFARVAELERALASREAQAQDERDET